MITNGVVIDALPAIDVELDSPATRLAVQKLIDEELKSMPAKDYLGSIATLMKDEELDSIVRKADEAAAKSREYFDNMAFPSPPTGDAAKSAKAWQEAVARAKLALLHQDGQALLQEQALDNGVAAGFLSSNKTLENAISYFRMATQDKARQAHDVQKTRQALQSKAYNQILRLTAKRNDSLLRRANCEIASTELKQLLAARGIDFDEAQSRRELSTALDSTDPRMNSTLRQYQAVHTHEAEEKEEEEEEETATKRHRVQ